jgi:hypothetical protein
MADPPVVEASNQTGAVTEVARVPLEKLRVECADEAFFALGPQECEDSQHAAVLPLVLD